MVAPKVYLRNALWDYNFLVDATCSSPSKIYIWMPVKYFVFFYILDVHSVFLALKKSEIIFIANGNF